MSGESDELDVVEFSENSKQVFRFDKGNALGLETICDHGCNVLPPLLRYGPSSLTQALFHEILKFSLASCARTNRCSTPDNRDSSS